MTDENYESFQKKVEKLKLNEEKMTKEQKKLYAVALNNLRSSIKEDLFILANEFILINLKVKNDDAGKECKKRIANILNEEKNTINKSINQFFSSYNIYEFFSILCPVNERVKKEGYGPYWLSNVYVDETGRYTSDIFEDMYGHRMWWSEEDNIWVSKENPKFVVLLPPTKELLEKVS